jgi:hypothetical protein
MVTPNNEPDHFDLHGVGSKHKDVHIVYSTTSITGKPLLNYKDSKGQQHNFTGADIRNLETEIDAMVTVTLQIVPDVHVITLTLLVPDVKLEGSARSFKTIAILTTNKKPFAGVPLIKGALQTYEVIELQGTASFVVF